MEISYFGVLAIRTNETVVSTYSSKGKRKYGFSISFRGGNHAELIRTHPYYKSRERARTEGNKLVKWAKEADLTSRDSELENRTIGVYTPSSFLQRIASTVIG
jgi:hypothetical protein